MTPVTAFPEVAFIRRTSVRVAGSGWLEKYAAAYEKCRLDRDFEAFMYRTIAYCLAAFLLALAAGALIAARGVADALPYTLAAAVLAPPAIFYCRLWSVVSQRNYRGALVDSTLVHAVGLMLAMASFNVPARHIFQSLSNLSEVYGKELALEATYLLALLEEDGLDVVSALRQAQATSPSTHWQELLIGITAVYSSGGSLKEYLEGRYQQLGEQKLLDVRRYNETVQGMASVYLSVIGIASIFVAILNLVFSMAGMVSGSTFVWIDALVVVPLGSLVLARVLKAASPEA